MISVNDNVKYGLIGCVVAGSLYYGWKYWNKNEEQ